MEYEKRFIDEEILFHEIKKQLAQGRQAAFVVTGMSMWPFLCHGRDQVIVTKVKADQLKLGDIILFSTKKKKYILHRITAIKGKKIQTTGDGNCYHDEWISNKNVVARVTKVIRKEKEISCTDWRWKLLSYFWIKVFPIRKYVIPCYLKLRR